MTRSPSPPPPAARAARAARALVDAHVAAAGLKRSRARDAVVDAFLGARGHLSVEELTARARRIAPGVGATTVYRALKLLEACGAAAAHRFDDGGTRYELAVGGEHHDHLVCDACGLVVEFEEPEIERLQEEVARRHGFTVERHTLQLHGRCRSCASGARARAAGRRS